jgi:hypothetical protein
MKLLLTLLSPYFAVIAFWVVWPNAWLAILAYHAQILFWNWPVLRKMRKPQGRRIWMLTIPSVLAGPLLYVMLPLIMRTHLSSWLDSGQWHPVYHAPRMPRQEGHFGHP